MNELPFQIGDRVVHMRDPFKEEHEVVDLVTQGFVDGARYIIKSDRTGEQMTLQVSRIGLAGWKKV